MDPVSPSTEYSGGSPRPALFPLSDAMPRPSKTAKKSGSEIIEEAFGGE